MRVSWSQCTHAAMSLLGTSAICYTRSTLPLWAADKVDAFLLTTLDDHVSVTTEVLPTPNSR